MPGIIAISTNPALDRVLVAPGRRLGGVVRAVRVYESAGGKAAQAARVARALAADVVLIAPIGGARGWRFRDLLAGAGVEGRLVHVESETRQTIAIVEDDGLLEVHEPGAGVTADEADLLVEVATRELGKAEVAIVSGSLPAGAPVDLHARLVRAARASGAFTILDSSSPEAFALAAQEQPGLVKPNLSEACHLEGCEAPADGDLDAAVDIGRRLAARHGTAVWLTLGERGSLLLREGRCAELSLAPGGPVRNAVGAGDALVGGLAAGLARGLPLLAAAALGVAAAGDTVTREASAVIDPALVERTRADVRIREIA